MMQIDPEVFEPYDRCGVKAYVWIDLGLVGILSYCKHHFEKYEPNLREIALEIIDHRDRLVVNRLVGVN